MLNSFVNRSSNSVIDLLQLPLNPGNLPHEALHLPAASVPLGGGLCVHPLHPRRLLELFLHRRPTARSVPGRAKVNIRFPAQLWSRPTIAHYVEECSPVSFPMVVLSGSMKVGVPNEEVIDETRQDVVI